MQEIAAAAMGSVVWGLGASTAAERRITSGELKQPELCIFLGRRERDSNPRTFRSAVFKTVHTHSSGFYYIPIPPIFLGPHC